MYNNYVYVCINVCIRPVVEVHLRDKELETIHFPLEVVKIVKEIIQKESPVIKSHVRTK